MNEADEIDEAYLDELDRQFFMNIDAITDSALSLLTIRNTKPKLIRFFEWFARGSRRTINGKGEPDFPTWLARLTRMSNSMKKKRYAADPMARIAVMIGDLMDDIAYIGTEQQHVDRSLEILGLLKNLSEETSQGNT
ncbi:hypothetical protein [Gimesia maris]|uniref:hypothetical protein n=2 Tax=Gimesia maris TaxID=122 RepID=UPI0032F022EB